MSKNPSDASSGDRGRDASSPWAMPLAAWKDILIRTWRESTKDNVGLVAAGVAFYAFLALVPLMGATVLTYGLVASPETVLKNITSLTNVLPTEAASLIGEQLMNVVETSSDKKGLGLLIALGVALFGARNAAGAIITALNIAYDEEEKRGFIKVTLLALAITVAAVAFAIIAIFAITALRFLASLIPNAPPFVLLLIRLITGILIFGGAAAAAATLYRYAPSREKAKWSWLTPGTALSALGWLLLSLAFGFYASRFANYGATYGSIAGVIALLTWTYLSCYIFLFGAELNSEFEHQTANDTTTGAAQPLGTRGAWSADHVADGAHDEGKESEPGDTPDLQTAPTPTVKIEGQESVGHPYVVSRATNRAARIAGGAKIGMAASALSTVGLGLLRRKGQAKAGAALLATAAGLSLLRRRDD
ncbi:MAG: YihY/virulence factor BrkB family protein [Pseudomonadota bacterium]|nr:YihY/virulence factor BrkB family protein [Pseudomonadota bacterium]